MRHVFSAVLFLGLFSSHFATACGPPGLASGMQIPKTFIFEGDGTFPGFLARR